METLYGGSRVGLVYLYGNFLPSVKPCELQRPPFTFYDCAQLVSSKKDDSLSQIVRLASSQRARSRLIFDLSHTANVLTESQIQLTIAPSPPILVRTGIFGESWV
jgi:hypothetical protein